MLKKHADLTLTLPPQLIPTIRILPEDDAYIKI